MQQYKTKMLNPEFRKQFKKELEEKIKNGGDSYSCMDIILELCEKHEVEPESINPIISRVMKSKIKEEAIEKNLIKGKKKAKLV